MPNFRTLKQNSIMHGLKAQLGLTHEDLREMAFEVSGKRTDHTSKLYVAEAKQIIDRLDAIANPNAEKDKWSPRTINYKRAKSNVVNIDTAKQAKLLNDLQFKYGHRTPSGLESICLRTIKLEKPRTTKDFNKIIEAVKRMNTGEEKSRESLNTEAA